MTHGGSGPGDQAATPEREDHVALVPSRQPRETALGRVRRLARFMPLVEAWRTPGTGRAALAASERDMLAIAHLSVQKGISLLVRMPGGLHRLPLLTAVMAAAESLDVPQPELSRLSGAAPPLGPVALISERIIRRTEVDQLHAGSVPVAPALHPHRLRADGLMAPVRGGRPRPVTGIARLLFVSPAAGFPVIQGILPRVVVIDAAAEAECSWLSLARSWASMHGSIIITIIDLHQDIEPLRTPASIETDPAVPDADMLPHPAAASRQEIQWIADWPWLLRTDAPPRRLAGQTGADQPDTASAQARGRAHLLAVEDPGMPDLAEMRRRIGRLRDPRGGPAPWPVRHAARLTRLLSELPTCTGDYDRVAPRYGGRTLRRLLDGILDADPGNDFPLSWHTKVAAEWGAIRAGLSTAYDALTARNPVTSVIADLVEDAYRTCQILDVVCASRSAQEALTGRLASFGTLRIEDMPLVTIRSLSTVDAAGAHQMTLLVGPPPSRWEARLSAADLGNLVVVGAAADLSRVHRSLLRAYSAPSCGQSAEARRIALAALTGMVPDAGEADSQEVPVSVTTEQVRHSPNSIVCLPDPGVLALAALAEPPEPVDPSLDDLETEPDSLGAAPEPGFPTHAGQVRAVPLVIRSAAAPEDSPPAAILLAAASRVQRLRGDEIRLAAVTSVTAGMTLIGVSEPERQTLFDRARPILAGQRPQAAALLLQLWRLALDDARAASGSSAELARMLADRGGSISEGAVRKWDDPARIGPIDPANVARIGKIAGSGVVAGEAARIAAVMQQARIQHAKVGAALVRLAGWHASNDSLALDRAAEILGPEITDLAAELTAWYVVAVGDQVLAPASALRRPMRVDEASQLSHQFPQVPDHVGRPEEAKGTEAAFLSARPPSDQEEP